MQANTPVVASACSSIPEVCGNAALFFNPYDEREIATRLYQVLEDPSMAECYKKRGRARLKALGELQETMLDDLLREMLQPPTEANSTC